MQDDKESMSITITITDDELAELRGLCVWIKWTQVMNFDAPSLKDKIIQRILDAVEESGE